MAANEDFETVRASLGLDDMAASLGFLRACVQSALASSRELVTTAATPADLHPLTSLVESAPKTLRFPDLAPAMADALLLPWTERNPVAEVREEIRVFLVGHLGDPRTLHAPRWHGVSDAAIHIMRRWVVGANLEDFFAVIGITAYDRQWEYREAFWMAYARREFIDNAWVVFGREAAREAKSLFDRKLHYYGLLDGALGDQSVIIMEIDNLTIVEGSHNWTCRIWKSRSKIAPRVGRQSYDKSELMHEALFEKRHMGSESAAWQTDLSEYIAKHTGRRCSYEDWFPKKKSKTRRRKVIPKPGPGAVRTQASSASVTPSYPTNAYSPSARTPQNVLIRMLANPRSPEGRIARCVGDHPGLKAAAIGKLVELERQAVNQVLYANLIVFEKDGEHRWRLRV